VGVLVNSVKSASPAEQAGIKVGDVITAIDGHEVDDPEGLRYRIATKPIDSTVRITLARNGHESTVDVHLSAPPDRPPRQATTIDGRVPLEGATVANIKPALAEEMDIEGAEQGVIVVKVQAGTIAARLGIQPGDRVLRVNGAAIKSVDDLVEAMRSKRDEWQLAIGRGGNVLNLQIGG
jgi:serine protease Do